MNSTQFEDLISIKEASDYCGLSERHLRLLLKQRKIRGKKVGRDWITTKSEIDKYLSVEHKPGRKSKIHNNLS